MSSRRRRRRKPVTLREQLFWSALFTAFGVVLLTAAVIFYGHTQRSSETQNHGIHDRALVDDVVNSTAQTRGGPVYTYVAYAQLSTPVDGHHFTTVHGRGHSRLRVLQTIPVLVDPRDPGYAEHPGAPLDTSSSWVFCVLGAIAPLAVGMLGLWSVARRLVTQIRAAGAGKSFKGMTPG